MPSHRALALATAVLTLAALAPGAASAATHRSGGRRSEQSRACPPHATALSYSDALNKLTYHGVEIGGLSSLAHDRRSRGYVSAVDNDGSAPERIWFFRNLTSPHVTRKPLILRKPNHSAFNGNDSDNEGLAVLPDGNFLVSSETEPSIRIYGRNGVQRAQLPVPARFDVAGSTAKGQATDNATLEGLTISPNGREIVAAMEGALSGDVSAKGDATYHRFLVYRASGNGSHVRWHLAKQIGYRAAGGMRVPEVALYGNDDLLVEEAGYSAATGNSVDLYAVPHLGAAKDVSGIANLSKAPHDVVAKTRIADLVKCPTLGAPAKEKQRNPLLDNFEGMAITGPDGRGGTGVSLISDDNFSPDQTTRVLNLRTQLP